MRGEPVGQQVLIGRTTGLPGLALAVPISGERGEVAGVLTASMATLLISSYITNRRIGDTGFAFLLNEDGKVIAHQSMRDETFREDFEDHPAFRAHVDQGLSNLVYQDPERGARVIAYMKGMDVGWTLVVQQDYDEVFAVVAVANRHAVITLLTTLAAVLLVSLLVSRRVTRPLRRLTSMANEASVANFQALQGAIPGADRRDEIGELARSVQRLAVSLRVALGRLKKTRAGPAPPRGAADAPRGTD